MASIRRVVHRTGRMSWQARWRDPTGVQRSKNFRRRIDAGKGFIHKVEIGLLREGPGEKDPLLLPPRQQSGR